MAGKYIAYGRSFSGDYATAEEAQRVAETSREGAVYVRQDIADARLAEVWDEAIKVAQAHRHVAPCDGIGCKQVIVQALEAARAAAGKGGE